MNRKPPIAVEDVCITNPKPILGRHLAILGFNSSDPGIQDATLARLQRAYPDAVRLQQAQP